MTIWLSFILSLTPLLERETTKCKQKRTKISFDNADISKEEERGETATTVYFISNRLFLWLPLTTRRVLISKFGIEEHFGGSEGGGIGGGWMS